MSETLERPGTETLEKSPQEIVEGYAGWNKLQEHLLDLVSGKDLENRPGKILRAWLVEERFEELSAMNQALNQEGTQFGFFVGHAIPEEVVAPLFKAIEDAGADMPEGRERNRFKLSAARKLIDGIGTWEANNG